jgi:hemerythrin-like domain-containing protein
MSPQPDLTTFAVLHRLMRDDSARLADAIGRVQELDRTERVPPIARWYEGFRAELHDHHTIEDEIFSPALVARLPETAPPLVGRIDADHERLAYLLGRMGVALERLGNPHVSFRLAHAEATMLADGLRELLRTHLAFEDADVVPLFARHFTAGEYDELEAGARKRVALRQLAFTIPWVLEGADDEERAHLLAAAPLPFKLLWIVTRGRYRRLAAATFEHAGSSEVQAV